MTFGFPFGERGVLDGDFLFTGSTRDFGVVLGTLGDFDGDEDGDGDGDDIDGDLDDGDFFLCTGGLAPGLGFGVLGDRSDLNGDDGIDIDLGLGERDGVFGTRGDGDSEGDGDAGCVDGVDGTSFSVTPGFRRVGLGDRYDFDFDGDTSDEGDLV